MNWSVTARLKNNGSCRTWLFQLVFSLGEFGMSGPATGIPAGGHIPPEYFRLNARELVNSTGENAVFYGFVDSEGASVTATTTEGETAAIKARLAPSSLRHRLDWLRSFRYFVYFFPASSPIESVSVFNRGGRLLYRARSSHGLFY